jgi:glycogen phosphorylase
MEQNPPEPPGGGRLGLDAEAIERDFRHYIAHTLGRDPGHRNAYYDHEALVLAVRDRLMERWTASAAARADRKVRRAYYLSMEYLLGRALGNALLNLDVEEPVRTALARVGSRLETVTEQEQDPGLGNGGLGRLAACFLDSCATLALPVLGYGIRFEYGVFRQRIADGRQVEEPEHWLLHGYPWEIERPEASQRVRFGGRTEAETDGNGLVRVRWMGTEDVWAVPYDLPIPGYRNGAVTSLRLWKAVGTDKFSLTEFNAGDYTAALVAKNRAERISMVLYPNDESEAGKRLRLRQQYFLASASLQDVIARWSREHGSDFSSFAEASCFQLNDTHPTVGVAELMRLLMDEHRLEWDEAWEITRSTMAYTNHTLLPEALERWPVRMFRELLPRLLEIVEEIDRRFREELSRRFPGDPDRVRRMAIIDRSGHHGEPAIRMAHLAVVACFSVNGVARLHTDLLTRHLFRDFHELWPEKFNSKTNGVTPRRWLAGCNPRLGALLTETLGDGWPTDLDRLEGLAPHAEDPGFRERWRAIKRANKERLAARVATITGVRLDPDALLDVQVKRIHEYKRQLLVVLHTIHLYDRILRGDGGNMTPRSVLIGGKAAPGYRMAKLIIELVGDVFRTVNAAPETDGLLAAVFYPDYRVTAIEAICPATDLSEQVSLAGKEASGTGNMKLMMNGALTVGTLDGANVEIFEALDTLTAAWEPAGSHYFRFGLSADEVAARRPHHDPRAVIEGDPDLARVMKLLAGGAFDRGEAGGFQPIVHQLTDGGDPWMVTADFRSYVEAQERADRAYRDAEAWSRSSVLNTAASGRFSSDRTIAEYNREIWKLEPVLP